jgi:hypothetical protein
MQHFVLRDLSLNQSVQSLGSSVFLPAPCFLNPVVGPVPKFYLNQTSPASMLIQCEAYEIRKIIESKDHGIKNLRHNLVADLNQDLTDMPMSILCQRQEDIGRFGTTPDFIDVDRRLIIELTTTNSTYDDSFISAYDGKVKKYYRALEELQDCTYYILVVGPERVYTNMNLGQAIVDDLCSRMRLGVALETEVVSILGSDIFQETNTEAEHRIKLMFNLMNYSIVDSVDFPVEKIIECSRGNLTKSESERVANILVKEWDKTGIATRTPITVLHDYLRGFDEDNSRTEQKRVCNFPMLYCERSQYYITGNLPRIDFYNSNLPGHLKTIWEGIQTSGKMAEETILEADSIRQSYLSQSEIDSTGSKHSYQRKQMVKIFTTSEDNEMLAKVGIEGRKLAYKNEIKENRQRTQKSFNPSTNTLDIESFITNKSLIRFSDYDDGDNYILSLIERAKEYSGTTSRPKMTSYKTFRDLIFSSNLVTYCDMISSIVLELGISQRTKCPENSFIFKRVRNFNVGLLIKTSKEHTFVSLAFPKSSTESFETGRLGPSVYETNNYYITDFSSFDEASLEHFVKAGPYMAAISSHLLSHYGILLEDMNQAGLLMEKNACIKYWQTLKSIMLCYLNNKLDVEELLTSQRYFFMNIMQDINPDPLGFTERLPSVLRSRLTVYFLNKTTKNMLYYLNNPVKKDYGSDEQGNSVISHDNLRSVYCDGFVTIEQKINEFYFGYVASKFRGKGGGASFGSIEKIMKYEYKYRDMEGSVLDKLEDPIIHKTDEDILKFTVDVFGEACQNKYGEKYKETFGLEILRVMSRQNFSELATLKASARDHNRPFCISEYDSRDTVSSILDKLRDKNIEEFLRRPKMMEALTTLIANIERDSGIKISYLDELVPFCLDILRHQGGFYCDVFDKPQHGGKREIHVLEVTARIVQFYFETISRTICSKFSEETITHPKTKDTFVPRHYREAGVSYKSFVTICKSADKSKWCQAHHSSKFCSMLLSLTPSYLHNYILVMMELWTKKIVVMPPNLIANFMKNRKVLSNNSTYNRMREDFFNGTGPFIAQEQNLESNKLRVKSGMFQGILHYTSSLCHLMHCTVMNAMIKKKFERDIGKKLITSFELGSDDSGRISSAPRGTELTDFEMTAYLTRLHDWEERMAGYLSMMSSKPKTVNGIINIYEYNSEWYLRQKVCKPTFRWVSACLEMTAIEKFIDRYRIYSNTLTQTLEGGSSTFECSLIECTQAWMHYKMMGLDNHVLFRHARDELLNFPDPAMGFFPMDHDFSTGLGGCDYKLYLLAKNSNYGSKLLSLDDLVDTPVFNYEGHRDKLLSWSLKGTKIKFSNLSKWQSLVDKMALGGIEKADKDISNNPRLVFGKHVRWEEEQTHMILKLFSPGVKSSLSSGQSTLRMAIASAYMLNRPCLVTDLSDDKLSLIHALKLRKVFNPRETKSLSDFFPNHKDYDELEHYIKGLHDSFVMEPSELSKRSKVRVEIFSAPHDDEFPLMDMVKRKWFGDRVVKVGSKHFEVLWVIFCEKYSFLRDTLEETQSGLKMSVLQLWSFLQNVQARSRSVTICDTAAKNSSVKSIISRIFWSGYKVRSVNENPRKLDLENLRSNLFAMVTYHWTDVMRDIAVTNALMEFEGLNVPLMDIPIKYQRLKIFSDYMKGNKSPYEKWVLIDSILRLKKGVIGYYSQRQTRNIYGKYSGVGQWRGNVCGVGCIINIMGQECIGIQVQKFADIESLGLVLIGLLTEFGVSPPSKFLPSKTAILLDKTGRFHAAQGEAIGCYQVSVDENLKVDVFDKFTKLTWSFKIKDHSLQLRAHESFDISNDGFTMLTDQLRSSDWDSDSVPLSEDEGFGHWVQGTSVSMGYLSNTMGNLSRTLLTYRPFSRQAHKRGEMAGWNMERLRNNLIRLVFPNAHNKKDLQYVEETNRHKPIDLELPTTDEIISKMLRMINEHFDSRLTKTIEDVKNWADRDEDDDMTAGIEILRQGFDFDVDPETINRFVEEIEDSGVMSKELSDVVSMANKSMPPTNHYFGSMTYHLPLDAVMTLEEIYKEINAGTFRAEGSVGRVLSFVFQMDLTPGMEMNDSGDEEVKDGLYNFSRNTSIISGSSVIGLDDIKNRIRELREVKVENPTLSSIVSTEINRLSNRLSVVAIQNSESNTGGIEDIVLFDKQKLILFMAEQESILKGDGVYEMMYETADEKIEFVMSILRKTIVTRVKNGTIPVESLSATKSQITKLQLNMETLNLLSFGMLMRIKLRIGKHIIARFGTDDMKIEIDYDLSVPKLSLIHTEILDKPSDINVTDNDSGAESGDESEDFFMEEDVDDTKRMLIIKTEMEELKKKEREKRALEGVDCQDDDFI